MPSHNDIAQAPVMTTRSLSAKVVVAGLRD
jgi:hypothetical protein